MTKHLDSTYFNQDVLPKYLNVSTISLSFQMKTTVNIDNIAKYVSLDENGICSIDYKGELRSLNDKKKKKKRKENNFYNSITMEIMGCGDKSINFKIFKNGGVQAAGCKNMLDGDYAINTLITTLNTELAIFDDEKKCMTEIKFIDSPIEICELKINLININFKLKFCINRESLHKILLASKTPCSYEKCKHAGVKIEFTPKKKDKPISIFIFESGSIVITGSKNEHHILEGYKVADKMKAHGSNASTFSDWYYYKVEVTDAIAYNAAIMHQVGLNVCINSDDAEMARRLNQEAGKVVRYGGVSEIEALKMVTLNPAIALHVSDKVGSIKVGKDADIVIWSNNPLSIYAKSEKTIVDGIVYWDREKDLEQRKKIQAERFRLTQKMIGEKKGGTAVRPAEPSWQEILSCGDHAHKDGIYTVDVQEVENLNQ
jgi:TATA-box binding protein (TBP) (component of TFIID and TFIIIB)